MWQGQRAADQRKSENHQFEVIFAHLLFLLCGATGIIEHQTAVHRFIVSFISYLLEHCFIETRPGNRLQQLEFS
jgi:hypothetical protein